MRPARPAPPPPPHPTGHHPARHRPPGSPGSLAAPAAHPGPTVTPRQRYVPPFPLSPTSSAGAGAARDSNHHQSVGTKLGSGGGPAWAWPPPAAGGAPRAAQPPQRVSSASGRFPPPPSRPPGLGAQSSNPNLIPIQQQRHFGASARSATTLSSFRRGLGNGEDDGQESLLKKYREMHLKMQQQQQQQQQAVATQQQPQLQPQPSTPKQHPRPTFSQVLQEVAPKMSPRPPPPETLTPISAAKSNHLLPPSTPPPKMPSSALAAAAAVGPSGDGGPDGGTGGELSPESELRRLLPSASLSTEPPSAGNGNMFQARTTVAGEVFIGRGATEAEARDKCCRKAVRFARMYWCREEGRFLQPHERKKASPTGSSAGGGEDGGGPSPTEQQRYEDMGLCKLEIVGHI